MSYPNRKVTRPGTTRRVRLDGYDYSTPNYYFITICTHHRNQYFGPITDDEIFLSSAGTMVVKTILELEDKFPTISLDSFAVMPNHVHLLLGLSVRLNDGPVETSLVDVIHWLKTTTHRRYRDGVRLGEMSPYDGAVWQEGYHDHIVRNERELDELRMYVSTNVERWDKDKFYDGFVDRRR